MDKGGNKDDMLKLDRNEKETVVFDFNDERVKRGKEPVATRRFAPGFSVCPK